MKMTPDEYYELMSEFEREYLIKIKVAEPQSVKPALDIYYDSKTSSIKFYCKRQLFEATTRNRDPDEDNRIIHIALPVPSFVHDTIYRFFLPKITFSFIDIAHYFEERKKGD